MPSIDKWSKVIYMRKPLQIYFYFYFKRVYIDIPQIPTVLEVKLEDAVQYYMIEKPTARKYP